MIKAMIAISVLAAFIAASNHDAARKQCEQKHTAEICNNVLK